MRVRTNARRLDRLEHLNRRHLEALAKWTEPDGDDARASLTLDPDGPEFRARYWLAALEMEGADGTARALLEMGPETGDDAALDFVTLALRSILSGAEGKGEGHPLPRVKGADRLRDPGRRSDAQTDLTALLYALADRVLSVGRQHLSSGLQ